MSDIAIENICLDGNRANNEFLNGNYVGCIFLRESNRITLRKVTARNFNGDGISWQVCHDVASITAIATTTPASVFIRARVRSEQS